MSRADTWKPDRRDPDDGRVRVTAIRIRADVARWAANEARRRNVGTEHVIETALIWMRDAITHDPTTNEQTDRRNRIRDARREVTP